MVYFLSDAHLGSRAIENPEAHQQTLIDMLNSMAKDATAIYLLGDMFDFWCEYFWRDKSKEQYRPFLQTLKALTDKGIDIHFFIGNHDLWVGDYLEKECGVILHREGLVTELYGKTFYLAHGDGLGDNDWKFKWLRRLFHNKLCQCLFASVHPRWGMDFGLAWAKHSRLKRKDGVEPPYMGEDKEHLIIYAKDYLKTHPDINYFVFGHRHIELDLMLSRTARVAILGDWISLFSYAVFDGEHFFMEQYIEGETEP